VEAPSRGRKRKLNFHWEKSRVALLAARQLINKKVNTRNGLRHSLLAAPGSRSTPQFIFRK